METIALLVAAWLLIGPIAALVIAMRTSKLEREKSAQLQDLGRRLEVLEKSLQKSPSEKREAALPLASPLPGPRPLAAEAATPASPAEVAARTPGPQAAAAQGGPSEDKAQIPAPAASLATTGTAGVAARPESPRGVRPLTPRPPSQNAFGQLRNIPWERLLGVSGAALAGGLLFALAAVLLFKHAFDEGWVKPPVRIALGYAAALACLGASWRFERSKAQALPGALAGAGLVAAYASTWAAHRLYAYLSEAGAMPLFMGITLLGGWLSVRRRSPTTAAIGLLGGYATPLLLMVREPSALSFFGYLLLLQLGVLWVSLRSRQAWLPLVALLLASGLQVSWWLRYGDTTSGYVLLLALGLQATLATAVGMGARWPLLDLSRSLTLACAGLWATLLAADGDWVEIGAGLGVLLALVLGAAIYVDRRIAPRLPLAPLLAGGSAVAMSFAWEAMRHTGPGTMAAGLRTALVGSLPLLVLFVEGLIGRRTAGSWRRALPGAVGGLMGALNPLALGLGISAGNQLALLLPFSMALLVLWTRTSPSLWSWFGPEPLAAAAALLSIGGGLVFRSMLGPAPGLWPWPLATFGALGVLAALSARFAGDPALGRARAAYAGLALSAWALLGPAQAPGLPGLPLLTGAVLVLAAGLSLAGGLPLFSWLALPCVAFSQGAWARAFGSQEFEPPLALLGTGLVALGVAALLLRQRPAHPSSGAAWALTPLALLPALDYLGQGYAEPFRLLPQALLSGAGAWGWPAGLSLLSAAVSRFGPETEAAWPGRRLSWTLAGLLGGAALGRVLEGSSELITVTGALFGASGLGLRHASAQTPWTPALTTLIAVFGLLLGLWRVALEGHLAFDPRFISLEAAALVALAVLAGTSAARFASRSERGPWRWLDALPLSVPLGIAGLLFGLLAASALALDAAAQDGERVSLLKASRSSTQTAVSLAWAAYALGLLVYGQRRGWVALRKGSLAVLSLALAKLFLFDLSYLRGLFRVVSIAGLASSLVLVSWIYQRLVFKTRKESPPPAGGAPGDGG
jgi:uncharacterized membrane protein